MNSTSSLATESLPASKPKKIHILEELNMRWYLGTQLISLTGYMMRAALMSLLVIDMVGKERAPSLIGLVASLNLIPGIILGIPAGIILDVYSKRRILQITASFGILQCLMLAWITHTHPDSHTIPVWEIVVAAIFGGLINGVDGVGRNAIVADAVVNQYNKRSGSIYFTSLYTGAMIIGNGLSGYFEHYVGYTVSFVVSGASFVVLLVGLHMLDFDHLPTEIKSLNGMWDKILNGGKYAFTESGIRVCFILSVFITVFGYAYNVILPIIAKVMFKGTSEDYSYLAIFAGAGSLVGTLSAIFWSERHALKFVITGCVTIGIAHLILANSTNLHHAAWFFAICGFGFMIAFVPLRGAIQHICRKESIGIVLGFVFVFFYAGMAISSYTSGWLAREFGSQPVLFVCGVVLIAIGIAAPFLPGIEELHYKEEPKKA